MEDKIKSYLAQIEQEKNIKILLACETGSRAWGFPSPDSDYDVRLIYVHRPDWYLSLTEKKDTIERMLENNDIDISGWDLRKSLRLLRKSNPPLLERIQSPMLYRSDADFLSDIHTLAQDCYSRIATMYHYLSMAKKGYDTVSNTSEYKLKSFFYTLRSAIVCQWIIEKEEVPPIEFRKAMEGVRIPPSLVNRIKELINLKSQVNESYLHRGEEELQDYIRQRIAEADEQAQSLPSASPTIDPLDVFFRNTIAAAWT